MSPSEGSSRIVRFLGIVVVEILVLKIQSRNQVSDSLFSPLSPEARALSVHCVSCVHLQVRADQVSHVSGHQGAQAHLQHRVKKIFESKLLSNYALVGNNHKMSLELVDATLLQ